LELAHYEANGVPVQGYLIQTSDGMNILIDTGWPQEMIGDYKRPGSLGVHMDEEDFVVQQLARLGLTPRDIHLLICTHFDPDHSGNHDAFPWAELVVQRTHYEVAKASSEQRAPSPWHMDEAGVRASTRQLVELAQREHVALIVHGHDPIQWQTLKKAPDYYR
jgi:N-acyl homoserine lactone hydrolase